MQYKVFALYASHTGQVYINYTTSLTEELIRLQEEPGDEWITRGRPWTLILLEVFQYETDAYLRKKDLESDAGLNYIRQSVLPLFR